MVIKFYITIVLVYFVGGLQAQGYTYTMQELEAKFLVQNYLLIASKFDVDKAEAILIQEKVWNNPTLSISEVNLWKTYDVEEQPFLFGQYGQNQQITVELQQLIETAGKRKKRVAIKELEKKSAVFNYEELLRSLKKDLRQTYHNLGRVKQEEEHLKNLVGLFERLEMQYRRQSEKQNVSKAEYYRIQTELISLEKDLIEMDVEKAEELHKLRVLTQLPNLTLDEIVYEKTNQQIQLSSRIPLDLAAVALEQNIGIKRQKNDLAISQKQLILEKAERKPDLTLGVNYDRGGNIMKDFVGIGVSLDLPIFNRNKGQIKVAQLDIEQEKVQFSALKFELENSVIQLQRQMQQYEKSLLKWQSQADEQTLMLDNYFKHLKNNQITLIEFVDFTQAYQLAQQAFLQTFEKYYSTYEELQYVVGVDFTN